MSWGLGFTSCTWGGTAAGGLGLLQEASREAPKQALKRATSTLAAGTARLARTDTGWLRSKLHKAPVLPSALGTVSEPDLQQQGNQDSAGTRRQHHPPLPN